MKFAPALTLVGSVSLSFAVAWDCSETRTEQRIYNQLAQDSLRTRTVTLDAAAVFQISEQLESWHRSFWDTLTPDTLGFSTTVYDTSYRRTVVLDTLARATVVWDTLRKGTVVVETTAVEIQPPIPLWMLDPRRTGEILLFP